MEKTINLYFHEYFSYNKIVKLLETNFESDYATWVKRQGGLCLKLWAFGQVGIPDRIVLGPGRIVFFVEFKQPKEKPRKIQLWFHNQIRERGFNVYICTSKQEAIQAYIQERHANPADNGD